MAGFSQESFEACLTNQKLLDDVNATMQRGATEFGVNSTPTFIINGKMVDIKAGATPPWQQLQAALNQALGQ